MFGFRLIGYRKSLLVPLWLASITTLADQNTNPPLYQEELRQQQRREALQTRLQPEPPEVNLRSIAPRKAIHFPLESPCFTISTIDLDGGNQRVHALLETLRQQALGKCLGTRGIHLLMTQMQNRLVDAGLITTRVLAPSQELTSGVLRLVILMGKVGNIRFAESSNREINLATVVPIASGDLVDVRDLEQGVENLQRLPGTEAQFRLLPGSEPGESVIVVDWQQEKPWRLSLTLDDAGSKQTGMLITSGLQELWSIISIVVRLSATVFNSEKYSIVVLMFGRQSYSI